MKRILLAAVGIVLLAGLGYVGKQLIWPDRLKSTAVRSLDVDLSLQGVNLSQGKDGRKLWNLNATSAEYTEARDSLTLTQPAIVYWRANNEPPLHVSAPHGQVWQKADRARMWDGVNATTGRYHLRSETLDYTGAQRSLVLNGTVEFSGDTVHGQAESLTYFLDTGDIAAQGHVQVTMNR